MNVKSNNLKSDTIYNLIVYKYNLWYSSPDRFHNAINKTNLNL